MNNTEAREHQTVNSNDMKELNLSINDVLYWGQQKFKLFSITHNPKYPFLFENEKGGYKAFTKYGQIETDTPPVLSFSKYNIEEAGATFEPAEPLRPVDVSTLQKVRFKDKQDMHWEYGFLLGHDENRLLPFTCLRYGAGWVPSTHQICEPFKWEETGLSSL